MVSKARDHYRQDKPFLAKGNRDFTFAFASLNKKDTRGQPKKFERNDHACVCGKKHSFSRCFYLNPSIRPGWFREVPAVRDQVNKALENDKLKNKVEAKLNRHGKESNSADDSSVLEVNFSAIEYEPKNELALSTALNENVKPTNPLFASWIVDSAGGRHICNASMKERLSNVRRSPSGFLTGVATTSSNIDASAYLFGNTSKGKRKVNIDEVAFVLRFHSNIISTKQLRRKHIYLNERRLALEDRHGKVLVKLQEFNGMLVIEHNPVDFILATPQKPLRRTEKDQSSAGTKDLWHKRLSHIGMDAVMQLPRTVNGIKITNQFEKTNPGEAVRLCEVCELTKSRRQFSRRPRERGVKPFQVISNESYNNAKYVVHVVDDATRSHIAVPAFSRTDLASFTTEMVAYVQKQLGAKVLVVQSDDDTTMRSSDII